jgi:hypothetical protein
MATVAQPFLAVIFQPVWKEPAQTVAQPFLAVLLDVMLKETVNV